METLDSFRNKLNSIEEIDDYDEKMAQEIFIIFKNSNENWENDDVIVQNVKNWSKLKNITHINLFKCIKNQSTNKKYACLLGFLYRWGIGIASDQEKAFHWYKVSAEIGDSLGQNELGSCYDYADGVDMDMSKAFYWYHKSALAGNAFGQHNIGLCFRLGIGTCQDDCQAFFWFQEAAKVGHRGGQTELGQCYSNGYGVKQDLRKGYYWLCRAATAGNTMAQSLVADRQQYGLGTFRDIHEAIKWHRKVIQAMEQPEYPKLIWLFQQDL
ncbi:12122_t:CDS:1 [Ambispora gerdemannii]|uniref:12122_t:CDS:1 n=1 Tax=Ambispora gerdemannii TaxID=144530 RepID=A0A9N9AJK0_9GLOM|nr:12122_t:CDS:1 [Ambispora gerdemannii]